MAKGPLSESIVPTLKPKRFLDGLHFFREFSKQRPIIAISVHPRPKVIALPALDCVIAKHIVSDAFPKESRIHHQRHFLEETEQSALVVEWYLSQFSIVFFE
jgi:hypothetical protein